jgi:hypothetical protein
MANPRWRHSTLVHAASPFEVEETARVSQEVIYVGEAHTVGPPASPVSPASPIRATKLLGDGISIKLTR